MPIGTALAIGAGTAALAGGIGNAIANSTANDRAQALQNQGLQQFLQLAIPDPKEQQVALQQFVQAGTLHPALQQAIAQNPSEFQKIATNAVYSNAQNRALSQLEQIGNQGGLRLQDRAALQDAQNQAAVAERSSRNQILADQARRGVAGSGFGIAAQLQGQQAVQDQLGRNSLQVAANAQDRALQAIEQAGSMAGNIRGQDFSEKSAKAAAADRINQFNTQNLRDVNAANTGYQNAAQQFNLQNAQDISNKNTQLANQQQMYNKGLLQQQYENQLKKAAGASGQYGQMASTEQQGGQMLGNTFSNMGKGVSDIFTSIYNDQKNKKQG